MNMCAQRLIIPIVHNLLWKAYSFPIPLYWFWIYVVHLHLLTSVPCEFCKAKITSILGIAREQCSFFCISARASTCKRPYFPHVEQARLDRGLHSFAPLVSIMPMLSNGWAVKKKKNRLQTDWFLIAFLNVTVDRETDLICARVCVFFI